MDYKGRISGTAGFTLIEVLTAVLILAISLTAVFELFSGATRASGRVRETGLALFLAREKMEEIFLRKTVVPGEERGTWENGYRWVVEIAEIPASGTGPSLANSYFSLFDIEVEVASPEGRPGPSLVLESRYLARRSLRPL